MTDRSLRTDDRETEIRRYAAMVYRLAFARTGNTADAEDVFQEVFLRYIQTPREFTSEEHRKAWLLRVTINCAKKLHAAPWRRWTEPLDEAVAAPEGEDAALWDQLRRLPEKDRTVLHLYYYEGLSTQEAAEVLGCRSATVRSRLTRARQKLGELLKEDDFR